LHQPLPSANREKEKKGKRSNVKNPQPPRRTKMRVIGELILAVLAIIYMLCAYLWPVALFVAALKIIF